MTKQYHRSKDDKDWRNRSHIDTSSILRCQAYVTDSLVPGPPRAIAYLYTARDTLTALRTEDIWHIFCFSSPFMSFEARRKSQYIKLVQTTSILCRWLLALMSLSAFLNRMTVVCRYFIWALSLLFGPCRLSEFTLAGPLNWISWAVKRHEAANMAQVST